MRLGKGRSRAALVPAREHLSGDTCPCVAHVRVGVDLGDPDEGCGEVGEA